MVAGGGWWRGKRSGRTGWSKQWRTQSGGRRSRGAVEGEGASSSETGMDEGHGERQGVWQRLRMASDMGEGEPWLLLAMFGHTSIILLPFMDS